MARPTAVTQSLGYRVVSYRVDTTAKSIMFGTFYQTHTFVKISTSFTSLISCHKTPTDLRETSEGTPRELPVTKK